MRAVSWRSFAGWALRTVFRFQSSGFTVTCGVYAVRGDHQQGILLTVRLCRERGIHRDQKGIGTETFDQHFAKRTTTARLSDCWAVDRRALCWSLRQRRNWRDPARSDRQRSRLLRRFCHGDDAAVVLMKCIRGRRYKVSAANLLPGDTVLFHRGAVFRGTLAAGKQLFPQQRQCQSQPAFRCAYGSGAKLVFLLPKRLTCRAIGSKRRGATSGVRSKLSARHRQHSVCKRKRRDRRI